MGWYSAVGRRAFFALPPETSHRIAVALLGLRLPWRRIGGAASDLRQVVTLAGIPLRNPIGLAAGFDKSCAHLDALGSLGFGYVVGGTRRFARPCSRWLSRRGATVQTRSRAATRAPSHPPASRPVAGGSRGSR